MMYQKQQQLTTSNKARRCPQLTAGVLKLTVQCDDALLCGVCGANVTAAGNDVSRHMSNKGAWFAGMAATAATAAQSYY